MTESITKQQLIDASEDAETLGQVVNGEPGNLVTTRLGRKVYTLASIGVRKAYTTLALAQADQVNLPANSAIEVTNDPTASNNGTYQWDGTTLTKSAYDPTSTSKLYSQSLNTQVKNQIKPLETYLNSQVVSPPSTTEYYTIARIGSAMLPEAVEDAKQFNNNEAIPGVQFTVAIGDVVEFYYTPVVGMVLFELNIGGAGGWAILSTTVRDASDIKFFSMTADRAMTLRLSSLVSGSLRVNGVAPTTTSLGAYVVLQGENISSDSKFAGYKTTTPITLAKGDTVQVVDGGAGHQPIFVESPKKDGKYWQAVGVSSANTSTTVSWTADSTIKVVLIGAPNCKFLITRANTLSKTLEENNKPLIATQNTVNTFLDPLLTAENEFLPFQSIARTGYGYLPAFAEDAKQFNNNEDIEGFELTLKQGDVLTFNYTPVVGTVLWDMIDPTIFSGWSLLSTTVRNPSDVRSHTFTAYKNMTVRISSAIRDSIKVNGAVPATITNLGTYIRLQGEDRSNAAKFKDFATSDFVVLQKGDTIKVDNPGTGHQPIFVESPKKDGKYWQAVGVAPENTATSVSWTADSDIRVVVIGAGGSSFAIQKKADLKNYIDTRLAQYDNGSPTELTTIVLPEIEYVFATHQNYILKTETVNAVDYISISTNLGKTWNRIVNTVGDIVTYHFFSDGTIMLCSSTKVFWTDDYTTLNESTIVDHDGSPFVPTSWHFFSQQNSDTVMEVGDTELYTWGEYVINNPTPRLWYTTDFGRTIKCSVKFGVTPQDGIAQSIRHVHRIVQNRKTEKFYLTTGDVGNECFFMEGIYDATGDTWSWKLIGKGDSFKFGNVFFDGVYAYIITDYTTAELKPKNGIFRVGLNHLHDVSKYRHIYVCDPAEWGEVAPFRLVMDGQGNKVLMLDYKGQGKLWVATGGWDFKKVSLHPPVLLSYVIGANYNGDIYCMSNKEEAEMSDNTKLKLSGGTYNLSQALRNAGLKNFMSSNLLVNNLVNVVE